MMLLIDVGNTQLKWGLATGGQPAVRGRVTHDLDLPSAVETLRCELQQVDTIWVASVQSEAFNKRLQVLLQNVWRCPVMFARSQKTQFGVTNIYQEPERLGVDRWLTLLAARAAAPATPTLVVDAGTALTLDTMDASGQHQGGYILPGYQLMIDSIIGRTARVRYQENEINDPDLIWGGSTAQAVIHGAAFASVATIETAIKVAKRQWPGLQSYLTGGDARTLLKHLKEPLNLDPDLVIKGLNIYAQYPPGQGSQQESLS